MAQKFVLHKKHTVYTAEMYPKFQVHQLAVQKAEMYFARLGTSKRSYSFKESLYNQIDGTLK